ncbi:hypothetical protein SAMN04487895_107221 [Paenibacillus sophorae]|uniref:DUF5317 domain-containing protein n=1 Tax=Paenibacillus sophorae TaxID=1333845 RepID=A0A1H8PIP7_9BACL|nr:DUF5317 domain-containing protein [Paenibacillus sophorae]QWU16590.1 DUF5317 domain-containing protein [Paenibacillus sophorae]SEO41785.1 hypothetical protein SAMN04487895_107221 [Paenibacillus sophorae]
MVYDGIVLGLVVGLLRGGFRYGLTQFGSLRIRGGLWFPLLLLLQFVVFELNDRSSAFAASSGIVFAAVYVAGLYILWLNRSTPGFLFIFAGVFLNFLVMAVNGGKMPVSLEAAKVLDPYYVHLLQSGAVVTKHFLMDSATRLSFLGDIIPLSKPYPRTQVISVGDIVMNVGIFLYLQHILVPDRRQIPTQEMEAKQS